MRVIRFLLVLALCPLASATTYYISQSGGSVNCGADGTQSTQAYSFTAYTTGDTLKLCGAINGPNTATSTVFTMQANNVSVIWESTGHLSVPACNTYSGGGCINTNGKTGLTFNGQCSTTTDAAGHTYCNPGVSNSIIVTANGTSLAHQVETEGIVASNCTNCLAKHATLTPPNVSSSVNTAMRPSPLLSGHSL